MNKNDGLAKTKGYETPIKLNEFEINRENTIKVEHPNGYTGILYGKSSLIVFKPDGKELMHTGFRNKNTKEELYNLLEYAPEFEGLLANSKKQRKKKRTNKYDGK